MLVFHFVLPQTSHASTVVLIEISYNSLANLVSKALLLSPTETIKSDPLPPGPARAAEEV